MVFETLRLRHDLFLRSLVWKIGVGYLLYDFVSHARFDKLF